MTINKDLRRVIELYAEESTLLDKLVVTAFVCNNRIVRYGEFIASFMDKGVDGLDLFSDLHRIEDVINIFELAVPRTDSITNGAIYTPAFVREFIVGECADRCSKPFSECDCADISCGCGAFLMTLADHLKKQEPGMSYQETYSHIWGVDICEESIRRAKILLSLRAALEGELIDVDTLHLWVGNTLSSEMNDRLGTFDVIVGNPPYVRARHIDDQSKDLLHH